MARKLDKIIVVDIESTCWDKDDPEGDPILRDANRIRTGEIIEIGICEVRLPSLDRDKKHSYLVIPENSKVNDFCTKLTGHTQEELEREGTSLKEAISRMNSEYQPKDRTWASYGDYDRRQFERECKSKQLEYPFSSTHINVKNLIAIMRGWDREIGMNVTLERLGLTLTGRHHNGGDDAWNIANIIAVYILGLKR